MNLARSVPVSSNLLHRLALNLVIDKERIDEPFTQNCGKFRRKQPIAPFDTICLRFPVASGLDKQTPRRSGIQTVRGQLPKFLSTRYWN